MKILAWAIALCLAFIPMLASAEEGDEITVEEGAEEILGEVDVSDWDEWFLSQPEEVRAFWDNRLPSDYLHDTVPGNDMDFSIGNILDSVSDLIRSLLPSTVIMFLAYMGFAILSGVFNGLRLSGGVSATAQLILSAAVGCFVLARVWMLIIECKDSINGIGTLMELVQPILIAVLMLFGSTQSAAVMQPMSAVLSGSIISILVKTVLPLAVIGGVVGVVDVLVGKERLSGMGRLCNRLSKWAAGLCSVLYLVVTTIRGIVANATDSVVLKTGRFAASSLPFVGRLVSDSLDTAYGCMVLVKNGVGITGILMGLIWVARPALLLIINILVLRGAAAFSSPISADSYPKVLTILADMLSAMLAALVAAVVMFIVTIGLLAGLGG